MTVSIGKYFLALLHEVNAFRTNNMYDDESTQLIPYPHAKTPSYVEPASAIDCMRRISETIIAAV